MLEAWYVADAHCPAQSIAERMAARTRTALQVCPRDGFAIHAGGAARGFDPSGAVIRRLRHENDLHSSWREHHVSRGSRGGPRPLSFGARSNSICWAANGTLS